MARYFMELSYRGAFFHGWQSQPNAVSVQSVVEDALSKVLRREMKIVGAGRTDTGVNARKMVAHFDVTCVDFNFDFERVVASLNSIVGRDIAVHRIYRVPDSLHARFDAVSRTYHYYVMGHKSPFAWPFSWQAPASGLNYEMMNRAAAIMLETDDFTSFAKLHSDAKTNICRVSEARWMPLGDDAWVFVISADRFLRNMVRAIVGTLVDVGRRKLSVDDFRRIIEKRDRCAAGTSMPPQALFLWDVKYDSIG